MEDFFSDQLFNYFRLNIECIYSVHLENGILTCYFHRYRYCLETGECLTVPTKPLKSYPVKLIDDRVWVKVR
ncbi:Rieske 2Fe-2S domain-containing protein [Candidatus Gracilibacteria bacterium]|nr:Rieske 2Fe-2S domain-containing protein [Candidatus Gracilibacteria bacterium]NJM88944.1 Rieske 2Fe-2S domain-containing protein [Hydrococcus sp. RU_2_2]NJP20801.1 Rieske 2Fe-2S domain-containing protein [Hydrococcus sp. CRU_1_1]NJQ97459.1 Rieske 2Fe-2S domain-containing protein [Hydrococcus sp. CSU_1_8]